MGVERFVEGGDGFAPHLLAFGHFVEIGLYVGGEIVVQDVGEILHQVVGDDKADFLGQELAFLGPGDFRLLAGLDAAVFEGEVGDLEGFALFVPLHGIAPSAGERVHGGRIGGRPADSQLFQFLHQRGFRIACRRRRIFAQGRYPVFLHQGAFGEVWQEDFFLVRLFVVAAFQIHLHESVEKQLDRLQAIEFGPFVGGNLEVGVHDPAFGHLGGHGPLPDELIELFLLGGAFDGDIFYIGGPDGFVGLLGAFGLGAVLARVGIGFSEILQDELLGRPKGQAGQVGGVGSHVSDETALIERLRHPHGGGNREMELPGGFLLEGGRGEGGGGNAHAFFLFHGTDAVDGADAVLEEGPGLVFGGKAGIQGGFHLHVGAFRPEGGFHAVEGLRTECHDFFFAVHDEAEGDALHAAGAQLGLDFPPQDGGEFKPHQPVQHAAGLLGVHQVHVYAAGVLDGFQDGVFGNLMEDDTAGLVLGKVQRLEQMPGDGFPFTVLIGGQPDGGSGIGQFLQLRDHFLLVRGNDILGREAVFDVHAQFMLFQIPDMADGCLDQIFFSQILLNGSHLSGRLHNH